MRRPSPSGGRRKAEDSDTHPSDIALGVAARQTPCYRMGMAILQRPVYVDDTTGKEVDMVRTVPFGFDGVAYEVDLSPETEEEFKKILDPYIVVSRRLGGAGRRASTQTASQLRADKEQRTAIRNWWIMNQEAAELPPPADRGRIPESVMDAYNKYGGLAVPTPEPVKKAAKKAAPKMPVAEQVSFSAE